MGGAGKWEGGSWRAYTSWEGDTTPMLPFLAAVKYWEEAEASESVLKTGSWVFPGECLLSGAQASRAQQPQDPNDPHHPPISPTDVSLFLGPSSLKPCFSSF